MIKRLYTSDDIAPYLERLVEIYIEAFSSPPWNRSIKKAEAIELLRRDVTFNRQIFLMYFEKDSLVGAALASPLEFHNEIARFFKEKILADTICLSRIFVSPKYQGKNIGKILHNERLKIAKAEGFLFAVQRTNPESKMYPIILETGFMPVVGCEVWHLRIMEGEIVSLPDKRVISFKKL